MTIVEADLVFAGRWRERHALVVQGGTILDVGEPRELADRYLDHERANWGHVAIVPGTVNAHGHSLHVLLRGMGTDLSAPRWRERVLFAAAERVDVEAMAAAARLDDAMLLRAGVTTTVDIVSLHDHGIEAAMAVATAAREVGIRVALARSMLDWEGAPRRARETPREAERTFGELTAALRGDRMAFAHPAPDSIHGASPEMIRTAADLAADLDLPMHIHVAETREEFERSMEETGLSPIASLDALGVLSARTLAAHAVWLAEGDLRLLSDRGAHVVHLPTTDGILGNGIAPVRELLEFEVPVALGTGGAAANGARSVFDEMRVAMAMARGRAGDASALGPAEVLPMGTSRGAEALRLPVGRIAPDHAADLVVLDLDELSIQPDRTASEQIVAGMHPRAIRRVVVGGETVVEDGTLVRVDERELVAKVREVVGGWGPVDEDALAGRR